MCPLCLIMSSMHRSRLPTEAAQPEEADSIYGLSLDAIAERLGVIRAQVTGRTIVENG
jgi:hypothetical protein